MNLTPAALPLTETDQGKPRIDSASGLADVRFNLSHSGDVALIAITEGIEVGVDIEATTEGRSFDYVQDWTRREAYLKGIGTGLRGRPTHLDFEPAGDGRWQVLDRGARVEGWTVVDLEAPDGYAAALAVQSELDVGVSVDATLLEGGQHSGGDPEVLDREAG